ncbi:hypothetical protein [Rhodopseudomonas palustris]|nr:hypothetical protein [Rhodopseudomonas palustris]
MRPLLIALVVAASPLAAAAQGLSQDRRPAKPLPAPTQTPTPARSNPCAAFGPGFVQVEGSATCVKLGGGIGVGVGTGGGSRR